MKVDLMRAIADKAKPLSLHYQPVKRLQSVMLPPTTYEAQIRMEGAAARLWLPSVLNNPHDCRILDRWVMLKVAERMRGDDNRYMVNVTSYSLVDEWFASTVEKSFEGIDTANRLIIEVLENKPVTKAAIATLKRLDGICQVYMDDLGVEHSNLDTVRSAPLAGVKIDGSFAAGMLLNKKNADILKGVFCMCESAGLVCVAEWVESREVLEAIAILHQLTPKLDLWVQGFYIDGL